MLIYNKFSRSSLSTLSKVITVIFDIGNCTIIGIKNFKLTDGSKRKIKTTDLHRRANNPYCIAPTVIEGKAVSIATTSTSGVGVGWWYIQVLYIHPQAILPSLHFQVTGKPTAISNIDTRGIIDFIEAIKLTKLNAPIIIRFQLTIPTIGTVWTAFYTIGHNGQRIAKLVVCIYRYSTLASLSKVIAVTFSIDNIVSTLRSKGFARLKGIECDIKASWGSVFIAIEDNSQGMWTRC